MSIEPVRKKSISIMRLTTRSSEADAFIGKKDRVISRRGAFIWLPVLCSNDVVHGSWWFVWGSFYSTILPIIILLNNKYLHIYPRDNSLPALGYYVTWLMLIFSGFFLTLGSLAFVRAFEEPPIPPIFKWKHVQTDELLGAWMFMLGTLPSVPYSLMWFFTYPSEVIYLAFLVASGFFVFCTYLFVLACYPSDKKHKQVIKPVVRVIFGRNHWIVKHLQNDWLAGTWFFLIATIVCFFGTLLLFFSAISKGNKEELFIYGMSLVDWIIFTIGCAYFVSGSYPEDKNKCYKSRTKKKKNDPREINDEDDDKDRLEESIHDELQE